MKQATYYLRHYWPSLVVTAVVWCLSLFPMPEIPELEDVPFYDKWTHMVMYGGLCLVIWTDYWRAHRRKTWSWQRLWTWGWLAPALMGGLLELLQANCTGGTRSGEWLDFWADVFGATVASVVMWLVIKAKRAAWR